MQAGPKKRSRKREPLSRERIVEAAFAVIDAEGLADFSTRKLAAVLGCEAMSVYHHFPSKAHLYDAMLDHVVASMEAPPVGLPLVESQRRWAYAYRAAALKHPGFFAHMSIHRMNTRTALRWLDRMIGEYRRAGFGDRDAAHRFRSLGYYIVGAVLDETNGYAKGPTAAEPVPFDAFQAEFPHALSAGPHFAKDQWARMFALGLEVMLEGLAKALSTSEAEI
jgi:AcrR family transcriptional regulator